MKKATKSSQFLGRGDWLKCECGGKANRVLLEVKPYGISIGKYKGYKCVRCGEGWFDETTVGKIEAVSRRLGLFGLVKEEKVAVAGNSLVVRIPKTLATFLKLKKGSLVRISPEDREKLVLEVMR